MTLPSLAVLGVIVAAVRGWFSSDRIMFHIAADEPAQLAMARWLAGGTRWNMFDHSTWRPGMATLLVPVFWFTDDTETIMRYGLAVAAVLGGVGAMLLACLAQRLTPLSPRACWWSAAVVALTPASLSATSYVWAEALVTVTFLGSLLLTIDFYDTGRQGSGAAAIVVSVFGFTAHGRLLPLVVIVAALVIGRRLVQRAWREAAILGLVAAGWAILGFAYAAWIFRHVWDRPGRSNTVGTVIERLPHVTDNLRSAVGQGWYQLVATGGLIAIGLGVATAASFGRRRSALPVVEAPTGDAVPTSDPVSAAPTIGVRDARVLLAFTMPLIVVSVVFMSGRSRADHRIYGRYNDAIVWPLLVVGIAWLVQLRRNARPARATLAIVAIVAALVASACAVDRWHGEEFASTVGVRPMIAGLLPVIGTRNIIPVFTLSIAAVIALAALLVASLVPRHTIVLAALGGAFVVGAGLRTHESMNLRLNSWQPTTEVAAIDELIPPDATIGVKFVPDVEYPKVKWDDQRRRAQLYQFSLPGHRLVRDYGVDDDVGPYVFAPLGDRELEAAGATVLWKDPKIKYGLWQEPAEPVSSPPDDKS